MSSEWTPTSHVVLGLLDRYGPSTPYDLKKRTAASIGYFWAFPHAQLYSEPARLAAAGLTNEVQEEHGRRRRVYTITDTGRSALRDWLSEPTSEHCELRDPGMLKLFFHEAGTGGDRSALAREQLAAHEARLTLYRDKLAVPTPERGVGAAETLRMGIAMERAFVAFWRDALSG